MQCQDFENFLQSYADGELDAGEALDLEAHLLECRTCHAIVVEQRALHQTLLKAGKASSRLNALPSSDFRARLLQGLERAQAEEQRPFWRRPSFAAAAMLLLLTGGSLAYVALERKAERHHQRAVLYAKDSIDRHRRGLPIEVKGEQPHIHNWFQGKVDFAPRIPNLRKVNLIGARISNLSDRQAAYLLYDANDSRRVSLFVFDAPDLEVRGGKRVADREILLTNQQGYNVVLWKDKEIAYSLVSDLDEQDILELVMSEAQQQQQPSSR
jgi:anti-sigma factor RsiW